LNRKNYARARICAQKLNGRLDSFEPKAPGQPSPRTAQLGM
jgi:hypothetical protein